jgi:PAS domain S-box-containing protein
MSMIANEDSHARTRSELRLAALVDTTTDAIVIIDHEQKITLVNRAAENMFGHPRDKLLGASINTLIPARFHHQHRQHIIRFGETGDSVRRMGGEANVMGLRANGEEFPIDASISHLTEDGKPFFTVILRDITQRKQTMRELETSRQYLRELYDGLQTVREEERKRVARELHDELGQTLAALRIDLTLLRNDLPKEREDLAARVRGLDDLLMDTINAVRRISSDLRPRPLDDLGLIAAVQMLAESVAQRHALTIRMHAPSKEIPLPDEISSPLFRMVQESLNNVVKHAQARHVDVTIETRDDKLCIVVEDDGIGMETAQAAKSESFGLIGMRERAWAMGGSIETTSSPDKGTRLTIVAPLTLAGVVTARSESP